MQNYTITMMHVKHITITIMHTGHLQVDCLVMCLKMTNALCLLDLLSVDYKLHMPYSLFETINMHTHGIHIHTYEDQSWLGTKSQNP